HGAAPIHGPGYPLFAGLVLWLTQESVLILQIVQSVAGALTAVVLFDIGRRMYGLRCGTVAGVLYATYAPLLLVETSLLAEGLLITLITVAVWLVVLPQTKFRIFLCGVAIGFAVITRPTALLFLPLLALFIRPRKWVALFALSAAYPIAPVLLQSWLVTGHVVLVQSRGGANLYVGDSPMLAGYRWPHPSGRLREALHGGVMPGGSFDRFHGEAWRAGIRDSAKEEHFFVQKTLDEIRSHPLAFVRLMAAKTIWFFQADEVRDSANIHFFALGSPVLRYGPGFGVTFALAAAGVFVAFREKRISWLLAGWIAIFAATSIGLIIGMRYRLPVVPPLMIFAGLAMSARWWRQATVVALLAFAVAHLWIHEPSHVLAEEYAMTGLSERREGHLDAARATALRAVRLDASSSLTWLALGDIEFSRRDAAAAETAWRRALLADPMTSAAWAHLGLAAVERHDYNAAERAFIQAISIRPDTEPLMNLASLYLLENRFDAARATVAEVLRLTDRNPAAYVLLARAALGQNDRRTAVEATRSAA